jgi:ribonuclease P protein component
MQAVMRAGKRIRTVHLDVRLLVSPLPYGRIGLVVPRHRHTAVERNRLKRQLRELVRLQLLSEVSAADVVIRARPEAYAASFELLGRDIEAVRGRV